MSRTPGPPQQPASPPTPEPPPSPTPEAPRPGPFTPARIGLALFCAGAVSLPLWAVDLPPITDLPQHMAQIQLLEQALTRPDGPFLVQWSTPYCLVYLLMAGLTQLWGLLAAGPLTVAMVMGLTCLAVHRLAAQQRVDPYSPVLAAVFVLSSPTYWGFLSFTLGWPLFLLWVGFLSRRPRLVLDARTVVGMLLLSALLYLAHVLWLAAACLWLGVRYLLWRRHLPSLLRGALLCLPAVIAVTLWYPRLAEYGFISKTYYSTPPSGRLGIDWLVSAALGGLRGSTEPVIFAALLSWAAAGLWQQRARLGEAVRFELLYPGLTLLGLALFLPGVYSNTIAFSGRWVPMALTLLLLAAPAPRFPRPRLGALAALSLVVAFSLATTLTWLRFEEEELSGLRPALAALPPGCTLLGLDTIKRSEYLQGRPFLQMHAWGEVLKGCTLNLSFADFAPSPVVFRTRRDNPWTYGLEWYAEWVTDDDFQHFDSVLINTTAAEHRRFAARPYLQPVTRKGRWRLYRVTGRPTGEGRR